MFKSNDFEEIVLVNFGMSIFYKENEHTKILGMAPKYCAPEIKFSDLSHITPKTDIFSFGMYPFLF